ncbi:MAG: bifunctional phosphoribosyl-AMP cyclohydrolase/phosphoribosyl-ATP diphosphatase HisIE [Bacillota bacterium]|nr:bifunctional phosphoribosyl-AMP cyclohydrolase/phosphoribosyl-ATP diphosphatase HisIE [Bacillota bacterium]
MSDFVSEVKFNHHGLVPAVAYDNISGQVVMLAYMNEESLRKTVETGYAHYFSRSRQELWKKGETSGHLQKVKAMKLDCDGDTILLEIEQEGAACHTGNKSCFYREFKDGQWVEAEENTSIARGMALEYSIIKERGENPVEGSYTNYLLEKGVDKICKKVGEESTEVVIAAKNRSHEELTYETADLIYHVSVLLYEQGLTWDDIGKEILSRRK